jgi:hypothetical protein
MELSIQNNGYFEQIVHQIERLTQLLVRTIAWVHYTNGISSLGTEYGGH